MEPDPAGPDLRGACAPFAFLDVCRDFESGRQEILANPPDLLVTNLRLQEYNGLHLVYLLASHHAPTRCIVYTHHNDASLIREAQLAGAFVEAPVRLRYALMSYLKAEHLPTHDRRSPTVYDRRRVFRGGRRSADVALVA